ncbi:uncharacterized protein J4E79_008903 [Alternaria viburni]|uniref:uncharacterized protein n=1 Tax=Alternaria viburni TaxID=566460 RepID=UPI0020C41C21|nr:uncharacterized protein J4E79_008903 [Alternaria viburni]KAI4652596.1 hypothetical protein J4E79_008903 [Alternaria viburni]
MKMQMLLKPTSNDAARGDQIDTEAYSCFARSIVSILLELSHGSAVCHWNKKRGKNYADEQTNEADIG